MENNFTKKKTKKEQAKSHKTYVCFLKVKYYLKTPTKLPRFTCYLTSFKAQQSNISKNPMRVPKTLLKVRKPTFTHGYICKNIKLKLYFTVKW